MKSIPSIVNSNDYIQTIKNVLSLLESQLEHSITSARSSCIKSLIFTFHKDSMKLFSHLKSLSSKSSSSLCTMNFKSIPFHDPTMKAEIFTYYFLSVSSHSNFSLPPAKDILSPILQLSTIDNSSTDVFESPTVLDNPRQLVVMLSIHWS